MTEFSGTEFDFAAGSMFGLRSWSMDEHGRLHGVTHMEVWRPGENLSVCKKSQPVRTGQCPTNARLLAERSGSKKKRREGLGFSVLGSCGKHCDGQSHWRENVAPHLFDPNCECGFWAYDEDGFTAHGPVTGVIEAYGKVTIGTKGFRAEKARIVALARTGESALSASVIQRLETLYRAPFYADKAELVDAFPGVRKQWSDETAEDFWTRPVRERSDGLVRFVNNYFTQSYSAARLGLSLYNTGQP